MKNNLKTKISAAALGLGVLGAAFGSAAAYDSATQGQKRNIAITKCFPDLTTWQDEYDRRESDKFYYNNEKNRTAINTALASGEFQHEWNAVKGFVQSRDDLLKTIETIKDDLCKNQASEDGELTNEQRSGMYGHLTTLYHTDQAILAIMHNLKEQGGKMAARGAPQPPSNIWLFQMYR